MKKGLVLGGVIGLAIIGTGLYFALSQDNSIGIIGGADGPTSIFVADKDSLDKKVSAAILAESQGRYLDGETIGEGHIILGSKEENNEIIVYALTMYGEYGFQDNNFVKVSGSGVIPAVIRINDKNKESFSSAIEWPKDGSGYIESIKEMFPEQYYDRVLSIKDEDRHVLEAMEEQYARNYLAQIGRQANIGDYGDFEHPLLTHLGVSVQVSNKLLEKNYSNYPMWVGNQEKIEDGITYVYQMDYDKDEKQIVLSKYNYETKAVVEKIVIDALTGEEI